jgi:Spy/CpxP family protein refolding chaperone
MVETGGSNAQHQVNREDDQQGEDGNFMPPVTLTSEQWQQLMSSRDGDSRSLRDRDGHAIY